MPPRGIGGFAGRSPRAVTEGGVNAPEQGVAVPENLLRSLVFFSGLVANRQIAGRHDTLIRCRSGFIERNRKFDTPFLVGRGGSDLDRPPDLAPAWHEGGDGVSPGFEAAE